MKRYIDLNMYQHFLSFGEIRMPAKIERKILRSGSSKVVALPPDWLRAFNINVGDKIELLYGLVVIVKPKGFKFNLDLLRRELDLIMELEKGVPL